MRHRGRLLSRGALLLACALLLAAGGGSGERPAAAENDPPGVDAVSYTHLRAHET